MRTIKQNELFNNLGGFLKSKGIELKDGQYSEGIRRACNLLGEAINATRKTAERAKEEVDRNLDQVRQCIHEATAPVSPQPPPVASTSPPAASPAPAPPVAPSAIAAKKAPAPETKKGRARRKSAAKPAKGKRKA